MNKRNLAIALAVSGLAVALCCWSVARDPRDDTQHRAAHQFRENLAMQAVEAWGKHNIRIERLSGPDDALTLVLQGADGSCTEPAVHLFILNSFGFIEPVKTITCNEQHSSITVQVRPYVDRIRKIFPMAPDKPDTKIEFGGTVTAMSPGSGSYKMTRFPSRQALIEFLQVEPRGHQFGTPSTLHERGFRIYADEQDDRILVVESAACDDLSYRIICFAFDGLSETTMVKWTELGGTFMVCKGERDMGLLGMRAAVESLGLYPVNSAAECTRRRIIDHCN